MRNLARSCFACAALLASATVGAVPDVFRFDPVHTQVWFTADHEQFSHPQGRLRVKDGWFQFDQKDWSTGRVDVTIDMTSADMGDPKWSDMVRGGQFLDAERWPIAHFISRSVEKKDDKNGVIHGDLTFHGVTKPLDVEFTFNRIGNDPYAFKTKAGFSAKATVPRSAFGITRYAEVVGENIQLRLEIEGIPDRGAADSATKERRMALKSDATRWGSLAKFFHWTVVLLILIQATVGLIMVELPKRPNVIPVFTFHKSLGLTILTLAVLRLVWRLFDRRPEEPANMPRWQVIAARFSHVLLYVLIFAVPLSGWLFDSATRLRPLYWFGLFQVPSLTGGQNEDLKDFAEDAHELLFWTLAAVAAVHAAAALKHHFFDKDDVLRRMLPGKRGLTRTP